MRTLLDSSLISHMTRAHWRFPLAAAIVLALTAGAGTQSPRPMGIVDLLNVPRVADPQLSPDGRDVLYTRADADWKVGRRVSHVWRAHRRRRRPADERRRRRERAALVA